MEIVSSIFVTSLGFYFGERFIKYIFKSEEIIDDKDLNKNIVKVNDLNKNSSLVYNDNDLEYLTEDLKQHLECGISGALFKDPVITPQGYTFEKNTIVNWLNTSEICPYTKSTLKNSDLTDNINLRNSVRFFLQFKYYYDLENNENI